MRPAIGTDVPDRLRDLQRSIEHAAHLLPSQGPITVFVHHNTLHAFEDLPFDQGVQQGGRTFGCNAYLPEERYRQKLARGRFRVADLEAVLIEDLGDEADRLVASFGTGYSLDLAMLQFPLRTGPAAELRWVIEETDGRRRFRKEVSDSVRKKMIADTQQWVTDALRDADGAATDILDGLFKTFGKRSMQSWSDRKWEAFVLHFLWQTCHDGVHALGQLTNGSRPFARHRDLLFESTGQDTDELVHELLIRFCSAMLDQGFAGWEMPGRETGFYRAFIDLYSTSYAAPTRWLLKLHHEVQRLAATSMSPLESIDESLSLLGISADDRDEFITQSLLALRGWAGMVWQMETNAEWAPHPAPAGSLVEFLAIRLMLDRLACDYVSPGCLAHNRPFDGLRDAVGETGNGNETEIARTDQRVFTVFQLAQVRGWQPEDLLRLSQEQWTTLVNEIGAFSNIERRRIYHLAFERKYRNETLDAVANHSQRRRELAGSSTPEHSDHGTESRPAYQIACCIDEREESFRRHLEEFDPECETFGIAGFFGVAMYYRGAADAHFTPLCPVNIKPQHYVVEEAIYSQQQSSQRRANARRRIGRATHQAHVKTRGLAGGFLTGLFGSLAAFPLVARILFPRTTAQLRRRVDRFVEPPMTQLRLERLDAEPGSSNRQLGYSIDEMVDIVEGGLRAIGLAKPELFSQLIVICGHGSASLNNPHEAAHDCGACGGGRGGPNARAFAQMANDARVRGKLHERGFVIPDDVTFVGGYHNTCDDSMTWYDLDRVPITHRIRFERAQAAVDEARKRSAHERCRRFESAELTLSIDEALRHVEGRAEDLSQPRPEYGHATNALCFVGRREWNRCLYLDRRAFLTSYDPTQDDERSSILERTLQAVIPVCAGINLEYYFSYVDPTGYGCGTKLPHNITSLLGVMDGAASDLRPGLPWQMVEIHEPVRLLFVIETTPAAMQRIINENSAIKKLVNGDWVQLAVVDTQTSQIHRYRNGEFKRYTPETTALPLVEESAQWYAGHRDHLGFASVHEQPPNQQLQAMEARND
jgi:uncharacterized protein YbcC (UPF0753/DUF2309 family)